MKEYNEFVQTLRLGVQTFVTTPKEFWKDTAIKYTDGLAADELRRLVNIETRREYGAFFTDSLLAKKVLELLKPSFTSKSFIYDPAVGAANLLIAVSDYIKKSGVNFNYKDHLLGTDIHTEFVEAAKLRLQINSLLNQSKSNISNKSLEFKKDISIIPGDGLLQNAFYKKATHIFVNPPFNQITTEEKLSWSNGKVSAAALFIDKIIQHSNPRATIIAILPDVLRSGSRYEKWRAMVNKECTIEKTELLGQFDKYADVDVYAIIMTKRGKVVRAITEYKKANTEKTNNTKKTINDMFDVCVGPVVDNRDAKKGPTLPYIVSRGLQGWSVQENVDLIRQYQGRSFKSPFVAVKRTSRMGDAQRAVATIINMPTPVFVDNHLIILKPISGTLRDCKKALEILKDKQTDYWLDDKIRCRHLTVKIVSEIPFINTITSKT